MEVGTMHSKKSASTWTPQGFRIVFRVYLILLAASFFILSCARPTTRITKDTPTMATTGHEAHELSSDDIERSLLEEYDRWEGTRHVLGGDDHDGIDCSAFVQAVYQNVFHVDLPRTTRGQLSVGKIVSLNKLRAGDLVFFKPPSAPRHVGIYLSGKQFVHASKSNGVTISQIDRVYWGKYYWTGRRILR
jgi:cell wall-associated NlpC family hydrolase